MIALARNLPDFAAPAPRSVPIPAPPPDPALLAAARAEGEAAGLARGLAEGEALGRSAERASREAEVAATLLAIAERMGAAEAVARERTEMQAEALARLLFAALDAALPGAAAARTPAMAATLLRGFTPPSDAVLRVAPGAADTVAAALPPGAPRVEPDEAVPPGDARLCWGGGSVGLVLAERRAALREALGLAGIAWAGESGESEE